MTSVTANDAIERAARLLDYAEVETDLAKLDRYEALAESWMSLASLVTDREHDRGVGG